MVDIFKFYFWVLGNLFDVLSSFVIVPGVNYLTFIVASFMIICILSFIYNVAKNESSVINHKIKEERKTIKKHRKESD